MGNFVEKHRKGLFIFSRSILFFLIALLLVDKFNIINVSRFVNHTFLVVLSFIFLFFYTFFYIKEDEDYYKKMFEPYSKYVFLFLLIIITLGSLQFAFLQNINGWSSIISIIKLYQLPLVLLSIGFGFFTFYFNRNEVEKEIEDEKNKEERDESLRKEEFEYKFPRINRVWGLRSLVRWMYGEGWWYSVGLILIVLLGAFFYFNGLSNYGFQGDEYYHVQVANNYLKTGELFRLNDCSIYSRSRITSLAPIFSAVFFKVMHINSSEEFVYRFPFAFISIFSIALIYFISKVYLSKRLSLIATALFSFEIWFIYFARYLRFYSVALFCFTLLFYLNLTAKKKIVYYISALIVLLLYWYLIDYLAIFVFFIMFLYFHNKKRLEKKDLIIVSFIVLFTLLVIFTQKDILIGLNISNIQRYLSWLFINFAPFMLLFFLGSVVFLFLKNKKTFSLYVFTLLLFISLLFYVTSQEVTFTFRPLYFFIPFCMILGVYVLSLTLSKNILYPFLIILIGLSLLVSFNYQVVSSGDRYYPTKLIHEKSDIIEDTHSLPLFLESYILENKLSNYKIVLLGGGASLANSDLIVDRYFGPSIPNIEEKTLQSFQEYLDSNKNETIIVIAPANIWSGRINYLYSYIYGVDYALEIDPRFSEYIKNNDVLFNEIYLGDDGYSRVYLVNQTDK